MIRPLSVVVLGLSIGSSRGNGHAATYRALLKGMAGRGHRVLFLERDHPWYTAWYAGPRDLPDPDFCRVARYDGLDALAARHADAVRRADLVIVGSGLPDGVAVGRWVQETARGITAFHDIDAPYTLAALEKGGNASLSAELVPGYDLYLSASGGPIPGRLEREFGARRARVLYPSVDPDVYYPELGPARWDLGYLGAYSADRQPMLERLLIDPAREWERGSFIVAGADYPATIGWPANVERVGQPAADEHRPFYTAQRFTLNITRAAMAAAGWSPGVGLFAAAACGSAIISDHWDGLDSLFTPGEEILVTDSADQVQGWLRDTPGHRARAMGRAARRRILSCHTGTHRAAELEGHVLEVLGGHRRARAL